MASAKFKVKKFNGQNSFSQWHAKMKALLPQQGLAKVLGERPYDEPSKEDKKKAHSASLLSLSNEVQCEVTGKETLVFGSNLRVYI